MTVKTGIEKFLCEHAAVSSPATCSYYKIALNLFSRYLNTQGIENVNEITREIYLDYIYHLRQTGIKNVSVQSYCRAVKAFCKWMYSLNYIDNDFSLKVKMPSDDSEIVIPLSNEEVSKCEDTFYLFGNFRLRNKCIFHLMLDCGLRSGEVIRLDRDDINFKEHYMIIRQSKYNKSRFVPVPGNLEELLSRYLNCAGSGSRCLGGNFVFAARNQQRITKDSINKMFVRLKTETSISRIHPHLLRHTFATSFVLGGGNLEVLRVLMGHSSYNVTQKYLHIAYQMQILNADIYKLDKIFFKNYNNS